MSEKECPTRTSLNHFWLFLIQMFPGTDRLCPPSSMLTAFYRGHPSGGRKTQAVVLDRTPRRAGLRHLLLEGRVSIRPLHVQVHPADLMLASGSLEKVEHLAAISKGRAGGQEASEPVGEAWLLFSEQI